MGRSKARKNRRAAAKIAKAKLEALNPPKQVGLFVTKELETAIEHCRENVERIAKDHRARNRKFRDSEFDLEHDTYTCLHGFTEAAQLASRVEIQRVTELFDQPYFFPENGAVHSNAIRQGVLGDCYFLSALATVSNVPGLIEKICVAYPSNSSKRDEQVGVYGFIFYQDHGWVSVIIDDLLMTRIPKWESLTAEQQLIYHEDKEQYNATARKGGNILLYAKAGAENETWVPLMEKAYAKLYTNFSHLDGGQTNHSVEDLTGGVSTIYVTRDILDADRFWKEELLFVNKDRLFACGFHNFVGSDGEHAVVQGLYGGHAYSVLRAIECNGKRFVIVRNPWGQGEWKGAWSDGSKEWTQEWIKYLPQLQHAFGEDGQFVMEYKDFLRAFENISRTYLFDDSWVASSSWVETPLPNEPRAPSYGTLSYRVDIPAKSKTIFVLSKLNDQAFRSIRKTIYINMTFAVVKLGELQPIQIVHESRPYAFRSLSFEAELEAGTYIVYVLIERMNIEGEDITIYTNDTFVNRGTKAISRILSAKVAKQSISENWDTALRDQFTAKSLEQAIAEDLLELTQAEEDASDDASNGTAGGTADTQTEEGAIGEAPNGTANGTAHTEENESSDAGGEETADASLSGDTVVGDPDSDEAPKAEPKQSSTSPFISMLLCHFIIGFLNALSRFGLTLMRLLSTAEIVHVPIVVSSPNPEPAQELQDVQAGDDDDEEEEEGEGEVEYVEEPAPAQAREDWRTLLSDPGATVILGLRLYTQSTEPAKVTGRLKGIGSLS